jgi:hypothetical protein
MISTAMNADLFPEDSTVGLKPPSNIPRASGVVGRITIPKRPPLDAAIIPVRLYTSLLFFPFFVCHFEWSREIFLPDIAEFALKSIVFVAKNLHG